VIPTLDVRCGLSSRGEQEGVLLGSLGSITTATSVFLGFILLPKMPEALETTPHHIGLILGLILLAKKMLLLEQVKLKWMKLES